MQVRILLVTLIGVLAAACSDASMGTAAPPIAERVALSGDRDGHHDRRHDHHDQDDEKCEDGDRDDRDGDGHGHDRHDVGLAATRGHDGGGRHEDRDHDEDDDDDESCGAGLAEIRGIKFLDANGNGVRDPEDVGGANWVIQLSGPVNRTAVTDASGNYAFTGLAAGTYLVCEVQQTDFTQTFPTSGAACPGGFGHSIVLSAGQVASGTDFGNGATPT